jgi:tetratricopeptide (TPR) repeat protein
MRRMDSTTNAAGFRALRPGAAMALCLALLTVCLAGCGESVDLKLDQARIAMANERPDRALSILDTVLAEDPGNREALLIQAQAQVDLDRLGPAKLTLDRLRKDRPDDPQIAGVLLDWALGAINTALDNPAYASTPDAQQAYARARAVADEQLEILGGQPDSGLRIGYSRALLDRSELTRLRIMIKHTGRMIQELGADAPVDPSAQGSTGAEPDGSAPAQTYAQRLEALEQARDRTRASLLAGLEDVIKRDPRHSDAVLMYLRVAVKEQMWDKLLALARDLGEVTDLPLAIADRAVNVLLTMPDSAAPRDERIELGWGLVAATPADAAESEVRQIASARLFLAADQTDEALPILDKLIEGGSLNPDAHYLFARALFATGDYTRCLEITQKMLPTMGSLSPVQSIYGLAQWRLGEFAEARQALRTALLLDPDNREAADAFATLMAQQGFIGASGEDVEAFYQLDPTNPRAIHYKLLSAAAGGDTQQIIRLLNGLESKPEHSREELGLLYIGNNLLKRYSAATRWARELVDAQPDQLDAWMRLAASQLRQGDEAGLADSLDQIARRFPDAPGRDQLTGELYLQTQQYEHAVAALGAAVEQDADNTRARIALARALAAMGRFNSALQQVQAVLESLPDDTETLALGSRVAYAAGQADQAAQYLKRIDPEDVDPVADPALAAQIYLRDGDLDTAAQICTKAISSGNNSPMLRLVLAGIYQKQDKPDRAEENLVALVRHYPNSAEAFAWLSQFYARQGLIDRGVQSLKEMEVYNETLALLSQAALLRAGDRVDEAVATLNPLLDRLIRQRDPMAPSVADAVAMLHKQQGDEDAATAVYDRLYAQRSKGSSTLIAELARTWDADTPSRRMANLDEAAARVSAGDSAGVIELCRRYAMLGRVDQALSLLQRGLAQKPNSQSLLGIKAGLLAMQGRTADAVDVYRQVIDLSPEDSEFRVPYARALSADGRRPQAEDELTQLIRTGGPAGLAARAALIETYQGLGLHGRAASAVNAVLDKIPPGQDAALDHAIGKSLMQQGRYAEAMTRLAAIDETSAYFPSAQVLYAQSETEAGDIQAATSRITALMTDPVMTRRVAPILLGLDPTSSVNRPLLSRADAEADTDAMPYELARRWLVLRLKLADRGGDWAYARDTLDRVSRLDDSDASVTALRAAVLYKLGQSSQAADLLTQSPRLEGSATGSLLAFALGTQPPKAGRRHPMAEVLEALASNNREGLEASAKGYAGIRTLFPDDLLASLSGVTPDQDAVASAGRDLAVATVALEGRMPGLAEALCASAVDKAPGFLPAYALLAAASVQTGKGVAGTLQQVRSVAPASSLTLMLTAMSLTLSGDHDGAIAALRELVSRHADNPHLSYQLAQEFNAAGQSAEAIEALRPIASGEGPYQLAAANDLAYLLARQGGDKLDEAVRLARGVLRALPTSPAVLDTAGWVEHRRGRDEAALRLLSKAIPALSDVPEAHYHIGAVYHALGRDRWARYHLKQAASGPKSSGGVRQAAELLAEMDAGPGVR